MTTPTCVRDFNSYPEYISVVTRYYLPFTLVSTTALIPKCDFKGCFTDFSI